MTTFDDPNRESLGLAPIWTGAGEATPPEEGGGETLPEDGGFDPGQHTVDEVLDYLDAHPDEADAVLDAERAGKARKSLIGDDDE